MDGMILKPFAVKQRWAAREAVESWKPFIGSYLESIARRCALSNGVLAGHIKCLVSFPDGGYLKASVVSSVIPADIMGEEPIPSSEMMLTLNIIVYGLETDRAKDIVDEAATELIDLSEGRFTIDHIAFEIPRNGKSMIKFSSIL